MIQSLKFTYELEKDGIMFLIKSFGNWIVLTGPGGDTY